MNGFDAFLLWIYTNLLSPHVYLYGFMADFRYAFVFAALALGSLVLGRAGKIEKGLFDWSLILIVVFVHHAIVCADVGQNQMFTAQSLRLSASHKLLNSAGYGTMGYSLPAAIGAAYAQPKSTVISINGDGGLQMNLQELQAVKRDRLPIKIVVLNNNCLGMIRRLQERIFDDRTVASVQGYESA